MTAWRISVLAALFAVIALAVVFLRAEQTRAAGRVLRLEAQWVQARRDLWLTRSGVARLRSPEQVHDRTARFGSEVLPPGTKDQTMPVRRLAVGRSRE